MAVGAFVVMVASGPPFKFSVVVMVELQPAHEKVKEGVGVVSTTRGSKLRGLPGTILILPVLASVIALKKLGSV